MNNKINLYRVHHYSDIRQGPYNFKDLELDIILRKNEPINNERKGYSSKIISPRRYYFKW